MSSYKRIQVTEEADVTVVRFVDHKILDVVLIEEFGEELFALVERDKRKKILLNLEDVEFLSSAAINKLIFLDRKVKFIQGQLRICGLRPEIREVFTITRLNTLFKILEDEPEAIASFQ